jgi:hypothetical protein
MKNLIYLLAAASFVNAYAQVEVEGFPNKVKLNANGEVDVRLFLTDNQTIDCAGEEFHFSFPYEGMGETWVSMFQEARVMGQALSIDYNESDCQVLAVSLPLLYEDGGTTNTGPLQETGALGNVALNGTNGLTSDSFSASSYYLSDSADAAFDGFTYKDKINEDATYKMSRGLWMAKRRNADGELTPAWLQVDFGKAVRLTSMRSIVNTQSLNLGRSPKDVVLYVSNDGTNFSILASTTLPRSESSNWTFPKTVTAQYFRLSVTNNYGDATFVEIDELEFFQ